MLQINLFHSLGFLLEEPFPPFCESMNTVVAADVQKI